MTRTSDTNRSLPGFDTVHGPVDGCYSADNPNPSLPQFIQRHATPYNPESEEQDIPAFTEAITTTKVTSTYNLHTYWSKKPHDAIRQYIRHYTEENQIVLDPFCGSGGTSLAALVEGRKAVAIDRSPAATFITKNYCLPVDAKGLLAAMEKVKRKVQTDFGWLYGTVCDRCGGKAAIHYTVYSQVFQCARCLKRIPLYDCVEAEGYTAAGKPKKITVCPHCHAAGHQEEISTRSERFGAIPVLVSYTCLNGCTPVRSERRHNDSSSKKREMFQKIDLKRIEEIAEKTIPHWYPPHKMMNVEDDTQPWGAEWREGRNFRAVADLFTKRNLWALSAMREAIQETGQYRDALMFAFTGILLGMSRMNRHRPDVSYPTNVMEGTYYLPQISEETVPWRHFENKVQKIAKAYQAADADLRSSAVAISTQSCTDLSTIPSNSVDYIFTDPPYANNVQYGELNFIWEAWLDMDTKWHNDEIIINEVRGTTEADWADMMGQAMAECYRVLKPGRWLSLCYHDTSEGTWALVQDIMAQAGFVVDKTDSAIFIDTGQKSYNQLTADKATKRDLVLNFRKPKAGDWAITQLFIPADADIPTFQDMGRQLIRDFLTAHPGSSKDRVFDELVSHMVRKGQMEAHDFDALLRSVAEEVRQPVKEDLFTDKEPDLLRSHITSRWYLKETADQIDRAEQEKEDGAAEHLEKYMASYLKKNPEQEGVHYSDLFERYLPVTDKPRRLLADWLPEYFFKTTDGTWRPPVDELERQQKAALREAGTLRRMKRFANALIDGVPVREQERPANDRTLAEWIRQCRRAGLYEQGRALFEKGGLNQGSLSEEEQIAVEDDYRICVKRKGDNEAKPRRRGRRKD